MSAGQQDAAPATAAPRNCYCGGPEEAVYGHRYGEGLYCHRKVAAAAPPAEVDNIGDGDRWEDPRDTTGGQP